ncbi:unknown [Sutterella wadsworthensis CAG:135]|nr:unknown [Sutterella wadsworthensis CAG:135]
MPSRTRIIGEPPVRFPPFSRYAEFVFRKAALKIAFAGSKALHVFLEVLIFTVIEHAALFRQILPEHSKIRIIGSIPLERELRSHHFYGVTGRHHHRQFARIAAAFCGFRPPRKLQLRIVITQSPQSGAYPAAHSCSIAPFDGNRADTHGSKLSFNIAFEVALKSFNLNGKGVSSMYCSRSKNDAEQADKDCGETDRRHHDEAYAAKS